MTPEVDEGFLRTGCCSHIRRRWSHPLQVPLDILEFHGLADTRSSLEGRSTLSQIAVGDTECQNTFSFGFKRLCESEGRDKSTKRKQYVLKLNDKARSIML